MCLFLRAWAFDKFYLLAWSTLEKYRWRAASSEHLEYFTLLRKFSLAGVSLLLIGNVVLRQVTVNNHAETSHQNNRCKPRAVQPIPEACSLSCCEQYTNTMQGSDVSITASIRQRNLISCADIRLKIHCHSWLFHIFPQIPWGRAGRLGYHFVAPGAYLSTCISSHRYVDALCT